MNADPGVVRSAAIPQQIADLVRAAINRGDWEPGTLLPAERVMAEQFKVSVGALRQGLAVLVAEGVLVKSHGKRSMVRGNPGPPLTITRTHADPCDELTHGAEPPTHRRENARSRIAALLGIPEGSALYVLDRAATHATGRRLLARRIVPSRTFDVIEDAPDPFGPRDAIIHALTQRYGPLSTADYIRPLMPDSDERDALRLGPGELLLEVVRVTRATDGTGLLANSQRYGEGVQLAYPLS